MVKFEYKKTAENDGRVVNCHVCLTLNPFELSRCSLCNSVLQHRTYHSIQNSLALLITGFILYIPANIYPIMYTNLLGQKSGSTIVGGVISLWQQGSYPISLVIFIASVLVPIGKMIALGWLCYGISQNKFKAHHKQHSIYRMTEFIGRWSMVDVFVVVILVSLIQMGNVMSIYPGVAAIAFAGMVISTMLAAMVFDPRLIWDPISKEISKN